MRFIGLLLVVCGQVQATSERFGLEEFVRHALENGGALKSQQAQVDFARGREDFARSKRWFGGSVESLFAPVPAATGNALQSSTDWNDWGGFVGLSVEIKQPIFTFGAIDSGIEAGRAGVRAEQALLEKEKWKLRYEIAELYYGYQLAFELTQLGEEIVKKIEASLKKVSRSSSAYLDLSYALADLRSKLLEARKSKDQARLAMGWKTGIAEESKILWDQSNLAVREFGFKDLGAYKDLLKDHRPEWAALEAEVKARKELFEVERGLSFPLLFLYAKGQAHWADHRVNDSSGPFAYDPSNTKSGIVGFGIKWDLDFLEKSAKRSQTRAEYLKALAQKGYFQQGMLLEVEKKFMDAQFRQQVLENYREVEQLSRQDYRDSLVAFGLKNSSGKQLLERMARYGQNKKQYLEAIYHYNLATHDLEKTIGSME